MRSSKRGRATPVTKPGAAPAAAPGRPQGGRALAIALILVGATVAAVHAPVLRARAIALDDDVFVTLNPLVTRPGWESARRFFTEVLEPSTVHAYYLPLSMTSLMVDYALGGRPGDPGVFHRTNLALHVLSTLLLLLIVRRLFGGLLVPALAALLFGLHPLVVEPIAAIGERKTMLASAFAFAAILGYLRSRDGGGSAWRAISVACYLLALLSKPSVTALPLLLLVLDWLRGRGFSWTAVVEKWPYLLLSALSAAITILSVARTWEFGPLPQTGFVHSALRIGYVIGFYLGKIVWPADLSPVYAPPASFTLGNPTVAFSAALVVAVTAGAAFAARFDRAPLAGWGLFVLALAPTFGILAWSTTIVYDRYVYFPAFGILIIVAAGLDRIRAAAARGAGVRITLLAAMAVLLAAEARATRATLGHWQDSLTLWRHVVRTAPHMAEAHNGLGATFDARFEHDAALEQFRQAVALDPDYSWARINLGSSLLRRGLTAEALEHFERARTLLPGDPKTAYLHGVGLIQAGRLADAEAELRRALRLKPDHIAARSRLATLPALAGRIDESITALEGVVAAAPDDAHPRLWLGVVLLRAPGREREAIAHLEEAVRLSPEWSEPLNQLAWLRATLPDPALRDGEEASRLAARAVALSGGNDPQVLDTQAAAEAAAGRFDVALRVARDALRIAEATPGVPFVEGIRARIALYERGIAFTEVPGGGTP